MIRVTAYSTKYTVNLSQEEMIGCSSSVGDPGRMRDVCRSPDFNAGRPGYASHLLRREALETSMKLRVTHTGAAAPNGTLSARSGAIAWFPQAISEGYSAIIRLLEPLLWLN
jgi:hypothetical protein